MRRWLCRGVGAGAIAALSVAACGEEFTSSSTATATGTATGTATATGTGTGATGGGGSSTTTTSAGGSTTTTVTTGAAGAGAHEDCTNGQDDNGDLLVDCADPYCAAFECFDVPPGWSPAMRMTGASATCGGAWPTELARGGTAVTGEPLGCGCVCGVASDVACAPSTTVRFWTGSNCTSTQLGSATVSASCSPVYVDAGTISGVTFEPPAATGGVCPAAQATETSRPDVTYEEPATLCTDAPLGEGCGDDERCAPSATLPCLVQQGDLDCPTGLNKELIYTDYDDGRVCVCQCSPRDTCPAEISFYGPDSCVTAIGATHNPTCSDPNLLNVLASAAMQTGQPGCANPQTDTNGVVTAIAPYTVCCP